jgi:hypothetical protein
MKTADEFLRELAKRVEILHVPVLDEDGEPQVDEVGKPETERQIGLLLDGYDADDFLALTGIRVE